MDYLLFQHDPKTGVLLHNDLGQRFFREDFYKDGLNCNPDTFDIECRETNEKYKKNRRREEVKNHHYIISFDPEDVTECGLTGERAQELCMDFVRKNFPGYQAIVVTHTDGDNHSGNIHTHIVINSVRKYAVERQDYMDKPNEEKAGYKHRSTNRFLTHLKKEVIPYPYLCLGRLRENQFNICLIQPVMAFRVCFLVLHSRNADLQGYKLHITGSGIFQVCLYPGQPDIPCANTVAVGNAAQKFADNFFRDKINRDLVNSF